MTKYQFKIRARAGVIIEHLNIAGKDLPDAQRKLLQMYRDCQVLSATALTGQGAGEIANLCNITP